MNRAIKPSIISGSIKAISSKSVAHRMLLCASLCKEQTIIKAIDYSKDIQASINAIQGIGSSVYVAKDSVTVIPKSVDISTKINCEESGSTLRFIMPIIGALGIDTLVDGKEGLARRPIKELCDTLRTGGLDVQNNSLPIHIKGQLKCGVYRIKGDISSQYISGLLMALPLLNGNSRIEIVGETVSSSYLDITVQVMSLFDVKVKKTSYGYEVLGNQEYKSPTEISVEGDWSNSAFWLVNGAINSDIYVTNLSYKSTQGDKAIIDYLKQLNATVIEKDEGFIVKKSNLVATTINIDDTPDLAPILAIAMATAKGTSVINGVDRLKIKESDRLLAIMQILNSMNINCQYVDNKLIIEGGKLKGTTIECQNDHRLVMAGAIAGAIAEGTTLLVGVQAVEKSYPSFFEDYVLLGGKYE